MADNAEQEPVFRASKRQKVFRRRRSSNEDEDKPTDVAAYAAAPDEDSSTPQIAKRPIARKHGVAFSSTARTQRENAAEEETAMVMHPDRQQNVAQVDRFVKPTGNAKVVDDKHLTAYVDSKLAEMRSSSTGTPTNNQSTSSTPAPPEHPNSSHREQSEQQNQRQPTDRTIDAADAPSRSTYVRPSGWQRTNTTTTTTNSNSKPRRKRRSPSPSTLARGSLIDQIMQESATAVPLYDRSTTASTFEAKKNGGGGGGDDEDNDEAVAEAFKQQFLKDMESRIRRKPVGYSAAKEKGVEAHGPKLGGSRAQRARMRAAQEAAGTIPKK